jgi:hypothetical protein
MNLLQLVGTAREPSRPVLWPSGARFRRAAGGSARSGVDTALRRATARYDDYSIKLRTPQPESKGSIFEIVYRRSVRVSDTIEPSCHRPSTVPADLVDLAPASSLTKNGARSPNDRSNSAIGRGFGNSEASTIGSKCRILNPAKHKRSDFSSLSSAFVHQALLHRLIHSSGSELCNGPQSIACWF